MVTHAWYVVVGADALRKQPVADLPGKNGRALPLELGDLADDLRCGYPRFTAPDRAGSDRAGLVISAQNLTHAAVRDLDRKQETQITHIILKRCEMLRA